MYNRFSGKFGPSHIGRREFLGTMGATTLGAAGLSIMSPFEFAKDAMAAEPSIQITTIEVATMSASWLNSTGYIIRINTNKGISGYGEIRNEDSGGGFGGGSTGGLAELTSMWPTLKGMNPTQIDTVFNAIRNTGTPDTNTSTTVNQCAMTDIPRHTGGMCAVECACWDILGKMHNVPIWKLLGPKYRDSMRMYADTGMQNSLTALNSAIDTRVGLGFTWYKHDITYNNGYFPNGALVNGTDYTNAGDSNFSYPYTVIHLTSSGMDKLLSYSQAYRARLVYNGTTAGGFDLTTAPISSDHNTGWTGPNYLDVTSANLWTQAMYDTSAQGPWGGWHEDIVPWWFSKGFNPNLAILDAIHAGNNSGGIANSAGKYNGLVNTKGTATPILTGEDMYCSDQYQAMIDAGSVDYIHPDPASSGAINQCRMAALYAASKGIYTAFHNSNGPFATAMNCHICAGIPEPYFLACELHYPDNYTQWQAYTIPQLNFVNGCIPIPMEPGLGVKPSTSLSFTTKTYT